MAISSAANTSTRANLAIIHLNFNSKLYQTDGRSKQTQISVSTKCCVLVVSDPVGGQPVNDCYLNAQADVVIW